MAQRDDFRNERAQLNSPLSRFFAIVPNDVDDLPQAVRAINVAGGGTIRCLGVDNRDDDPPVTLNVIPGVLLPIRLKKIFVTGTSAIGIVGGV